MRPLWSPSLERGGAFLESAKGFGMAASPLRGQAFKFAPRPTPPCPTGSHNGTPSPMTAPLYLATPPRAGLILCPRLLPLIAGCELSTLNWSSLGRSQKRPPGREDAVAVPALHPSGPESDSDSIWICPLYGGRCFRHKEEGRLSLDPAVGFSRSAAATSQWGDLHHAPLHAGNFLPQKPKRKIK